MPPNNQGNATPFYNQGDNGENPAKDGVATFAELDQYTWQSIATLDGGYIASRASATTACGHPVHLRSADAPQPRQGFPGRVQPASDGTGDSGRRTGRGPADRRRLRDDEPRRFTILHDGLKRPDVFGDWVQVARQGNPLFNEGLVAIEDKDLCSRTSPSSDKALFQKARTESRAREAPQSPGARARRAGDRNGPHGHRRDLHP